MCAPRLKKKNVGNGQRMSGDFGRLLHDGLIATQHVSAGAIVRRKDGHVRATTLGFALTPEDIKAISVAFKETSRRQPLVINKIEYQCVRADKYSVYGKQVRAAPWQDRMLRGVAAWVLFAVLYFFHPLAAAL